MESNYEENDVFTLDDPIQENPEMQEPLDDSNLVYEDSDLDNLNQSGADSDYIESLLRAKGIDPENVQIYDEDGNIQKVNFNDLSNDEKYSLLGEQDPDQDVSDFFTDDELETINYLRQTGLSLEDFARLQQEAAINRYLANQTPTTDIDNLSDEEVVAYDYVMRFGEDMSDEEIDSEIERLKEDEESFNKRVNLLRRTYKTQQMDALKAIEEQDLQRKQVEEQNFINAYYNAASSFNDVQGVSLDNNDKDELLNFVLAKDAANRTAFSKAMDDPRNVLRMAWFLLHGEEVFDATTDYYRAEIAKARSSLAPRSVNKTAARKNTNRQDKFNFNV